MNPTGDAGTVDLHLQASNPAEGQGLSIASVTDDSMGRRAARSHPWISVLMLEASPQQRCLRTRHQLSAAHQRSTANRVLTGWATITDIVGVSGGANAPRLYFKKSTDTDVFAWRTTPPGNGWKYITGTDAGGGSYSFTLGLFHHQLAAASQLVTPCNISSSRRTTRTTSVPAPSSRTPLRILRCRT